MRGALIQPQILRWARERLSLPMETLAGKLQINPDRLRSWEGGETMPTFLQAKNLAHALHVPFGYLFLSTPPKEATPLPDLRTLRDAEAGKLSVDFIDVLHSALRKHEWYRDFLMEEGAGPLDFIGSASVDQTPEITAESIIKTLKVDDELRHHARNWEDFLREFILSVEDKGILVMRSGIVGNNSHRPLSVSEFRGFAICDKYAPLVFINGRDTRAAQIFTLAHEIAHLWLGEGGISNPDLGEIRSGQSKRIEQVCNRIAAEVLVPCEDFHSTWKGGLSTNQNMTVLARKFRVSSLVILRRAMDLKKITREVFSREYNKELNRFKAAEKQRKESGKGGDTFDNLQTRNSRRLTTTVVSAAYEGRLLLRDAAKLLDIKKVTTLGNLAVELGIR